MKERLGIGGPVTVQTEVNGDSKSTNERGPSLLHWACRADTRDFCPVLTALVVAVQKNTFFLTVDYFIPCVPIQQAGQEVVLGRISLIMCICLWV